MCSVSSSQTSVTCLPTLSLAADLQELMKHLAGFTVAIVNHTSCPANN